MLKAILAVAAALFLGAQAQAAALIVDGGQLTGATGVQYDGALYDVSFLDGTCIDLFNGCNDAAEDFAFTTSDDAGGFAQALLDQVFVDTAEGNFDTEPALTRGCDSTAQCRIGIPYSVNDFISSLRGSQNSPAGVLDFVFSTHEGRHTDFIALSAATFAVVTPAAVIPLPAGAALIVTGLAALGLLRRRA